MSPRVGAGTGGAGSGRDPRSLNTGVGLEDWKREGPGAAAADFGDAQGQGNLQARNVRPGPDTVMRGDVSGGTWRATTKKTRVFEADPEKEVEPEL